MKDDLTDREREVSERVTEVVVARLSEGGSVEEISEAVRRVSGWPEHETGEFVARIQGRIMEEHRRSNAGRLGLRDESTRRMVFWLLLMVGGGALAGIIYAAAGGG